MEGYSSPFSNSDRKEAKHSFEYVEINTKKSFGNDHEIKFHSAGHIPGSLMFELVGSRKALFTGDWNVIGTRLMKKGKPVSCDILFLEGTYAGREHPKREELEREFLDKIEDVVTRGGIVVIPSFALARSVILK